MASHSARSRIKRALAAQLGQRRLEEVSTGAEPKSRPKPLGKSGLSPLLRAAFLDLELIPYPKRLLAQRFNMYAQNEEDGLVLALVKEAGIGTRRLVEIGCGDNGGNSGFLAHELAYSGLMVDGDAERVHRAARQFHPTRIQVRECFVTAENVDAILEDARLTGEIDFLSIDIDGNDLWIWCAVTAVQPRIVCLEYNSLFGSTEAVAVPYDPSFSRYDVEGMDRRYYGCSLKAIEVVAGRKGYRLVVVEPRGTNALLLRNDVATHVPAVATEDAYRLLNKHSRVQDGGFDIFAEARAHGLELVDVAADGTIGSAR